MNITVRIGTSERQLSDVDERWINEEITRHRASGVPICVAVKIQEDDVDMTLTTPGCPGTGGGGRPPNQKERSIFDLWERFKLDTNDFTGGHLIALLK